LAAIVSLPGARIVAPRDLAGTTVGTAGAGYQADFLRAIVDRAGIDPARVQRRDVGFALNDALLARRVDATLGGGWNQQAIDLRLRGRTPSVIRVGEAGVPTYDELVLVANEDALERDGGRIRAFIAALGRGTQDLRRGSDAAVERLVEASPGLDPQVARAAVEQTLPLLMPERGRPFGSIDGESWQEFVAWMNDNGLLESTPDASEAFTNGYLPGAGL
jgi:putative hydroxymethylpyrimidine transport system substrate-binding protein